MRIADLKQSIRADMELDAADLQGVREGALEAEPEEVRDEELYELACDAAARGNVELVMAMDTSVDPSVQASLVASPVLGMRRAAHFAAEHGQVAVIQALDASANPAVRASLAEPDAYGLTPSHLAAGNGHAAVIIALNAVDLAPVRDSLAAVDSLGWTPVRFAVDRGHADAVTALGACDSLFVQGTLVARYGRLGQRLPHIAAEQGHTAVIEALCAMANPSVQASLASSDAAGQVPAHSAIRNGHWAAFIALGSSAEPMVRASLAVRDRDGHTPEQLARLQPGGDEIVDVVMPETLALSRAADDLRAPDAIARANSLLDELRCPLLGRSYTTFGEMRPVYLLRADAVEGAAVGTPMKHCMSAAAVEGIRAAPAGQVHPYTREPFRGTQDAQDQIRLLREVAQAYLHNEDNLSVAREAAHAAHVARRDGVVLPAANAAPNADAPARAAGPGHYQEFVVRVPEANGAARPEAGRGAGAPQP